MKRYWARPGHAILPLMLATGLTASAPFPDAQNMTTGKAAPPTRVPSHIFISGHSLTERPYPEMLATVFAQTGQTVRIDTANRFGTSIKDRLAATNPSLSPPTVPNHADTMIVAEQHSLIDNLVWNDSVQSLRAMHDRFIAENPTGQSFLFTAWLGVDAARAGRWIEFERGAAPVWECLARRVNMTLEADGRTDRIGVIPTALALANLVAMASAVHVPGVANADADRALATLFEDDVHPTPTGAYYAALVTHAWLGKGQSPIEQPASGIPLAAQQSLPPIADRFVREYRLTMQPMSMQACRDYLRQEFIGQYLRYIRPTYANQGLKGQIQWFRHRVEWAILFGRNSPRNPFFHR